MQFSTSCLHLSAVGESCSAMVAHLGHTPGPFVQTCCASEGFRHDWGSFAEVLYYGQPISWWPCNFGYHTWWLCQLDFHPVRALPSNASATRPNQWSGREKRAISGQGNGTCISEGDDDGDDGDDDGDDGDDDDVGDDDDDACDDLLFCVSDVVCDRIVGRSQRWEAARFLGRRPGFPRGWPQTAWRESFGLTKKGSDAATQQDQKHTLKIRSCMSLHESSCWGTEKVIFVQHLHIEYVQKLSGVRDLMSRVSRGASTCTFKMMEGQFPPICLSLGSPFTTVIIFGGMVSFRQPCVSLTWHRRTRPSSGTSIPRAT